MLPDDQLKSSIASLYARYSRLPRKEAETEKKAEEYLSELFRFFGWDWLSQEVMPQKQVRIAGKTKRVDYSFKKAGRTRADFYMEVKKFSENLENPVHVEQAIGYGKNSGIRWVVLTNFARWRIFNSDFYDEPNNAELVASFDLMEAIYDEEKLRWLKLLSRDEGGSALDEYAKKHRKWKDSEDVEELLTEQLIDTRKKLSKAIYEQNGMLFETDDNEESRQNGEEDKSVDSCVQHVLDRIIFCRMLEDNGSEPDFRMEELYNAWKADKRVQFYHEHLCDFWAKMRKRYDSTIFDSHRIDGIRIKNEDFIPVLESFYVNPRTKLRYRFEAIGTDILGHTYENFLSYNPKQTAKRAGLEKKQYARKQSGIYYTPEFLVDHLVRSSLGKRLSDCKTPADALKIRVIDPACGSGTFLVRAFEEFKNWYLAHNRKNGGAEQAKLDADSDSGLSTFLDSVLENCIYGIDLDLRAVRLAKLNLFLRAIDTPNQLPRLKIIQKNTLVWSEMPTKQFRFERDFPLVHEAGGFDVVIGNPPWEKWKPDSQEFFEEFHEGFKSLSAQEAKKVMEEILKRKTIAGVWKMKLFQYEQYSDYFRENYVFQSAEAAGRKVSGDLDLYKLFTEKAYNILKPGGVAGLVIPSGIYTDLGAKGLRTMLFDKCSVKELWSFENKGHAIFEDVHASYKFVLLTFEKGGSTKSFPCAFFLHTDEDLKNAVEKPTIMDVEFIRRSSPTSWNVLEIKTPKDLEIIEKLLKHPSLGEKLQGAWNLDISRGFDMTNDSHLFKEGKLGGVPLLEGKNMEQFTHQWKEAPAARYTVSEEDIKKNLKPESIYHTDYWMAYRLIASSTNYRTFISAIIPPGYVCGNSLAIIKMPTLKELCYLCGVMNSFVIDYFMRQKVSANINMFYFLETPVPRLSSGKEFEEIAKKTAQLVATTDEFSALRKEFGISGGLADGNDRLLARAKIDVAVAKLYGITKEELAYILEKFPLVDAKQKEMVMREY